MGLELVIDETVVLDFMTYDAAGLPADADSLPTIEIYEDATDAAMGYAPTVVSRSLDGHYRVTIEPTGANGFEVGKAYHIYVLATIATDDYKTKLDWAVARTYSIDSLQSAIDSVLAAIQGQTDLIPADPATETTLAAIQAQTDLIPADPATETTLASIPGDVWEELAASHVTADTMGELLNGAGNPWSIAVTGNTDAGTFGEAVEATRAQAALIPADPATETTLAAIQAQTDLIPADPATETTLATIPGLVWEELSASHVTADTMGELLNGAGNPWSILTTGNVDAGTFGEAVVAIQAQTDLLPADPATETTLAAIKAQTDLIPADPATETTVSGVPAAVWEELSASHVTAATMGEALNLADDIKAQTDLIPADPATETTLAAIQGQTDLIPADPATETTVLTVPGLVWEELAASHVTADTMGELLNGAGNPWSILVTGNTDAGTFGEAVTLIQAQTDLIPADPATETTLAAIKAQTDLIPADPATETTLAVIQGQTDLIPADTATEATLAVIQAQTDLIPADPATESTLATIEGTLAAADIVQAAISSDVWDVVSASHVTAGTTGKRLADAAAAGNPWSTTVAGNTDAGTFGELLGTTLPDDVANVYDDTHTTGVAVKDGAISSDSFTVGTVDGVESGLLEQIRQLWRRFFKKTVYNKTGNNIKTYADDGTTVVTTQTTANSSTEQSQGPAS